MSSTDTPYNQGTPEPIPGTVNRTDAPLKYTTIPVDPGTKKPPASFIYGKEYKGFAYDTDYSGGSEHIGHVTSESTGLVVIDVDDPVAFKATELGKVYRADDATYVRADGSGKFHVYLDAREAAEFPRQFLGGKGLGYDIKSNGFVRAEPAYVPVEDAIILKWEPYTAEALAADQEDYRQAHGGSSPSSPGSYSGPQSWLSVPDDSLGTNSELYRHAIRMAGSTEDEIIAELERVSVALAEDWTDASLRMIARSAMRSDVRKAADEVTETYNGWGVTEEQLARFAERARAREDAVAMLPFPAESATIAAAEEQAVNLSIADLFHCNAQQLPSWSRIKPETFTRWVSQFVLPGRSRDGRTWAYWLTPQDDGTPVSTWVPQDELAEKLLTAALGDRFSSGLVSTVERYMRQATPYFIDPGSADSDVISFTNWAYRISTGQFEQHSPAHLSTVQLAVPYVTEQRCPAFMRWLEWAVGKKNRLLAMELIAYAMYSGNPLQAAVMLTTMPDTTTTGGNGKSTFLEVIRGICGVRNTSAVSLQRLTSDNPFSAAPLYGKLANICGDISSEALRDTAMFKAITGEDLISCEFKGKDAFSFESFATPFFSANEIPVSPDVTSAYFRRWVILPFVNSAERSPLPGFSKAEMMKELPAVASLALRLLPGVLRNGLTLDEEAQDMFRMQSDSAAPIIDEYFTRGEEEWVTGSDAWKVYQAASGKLGKHRFFRRLRELPGVSYHDAMRIPGVSKTVRGFKGIGLSDAVSISYFGGVALE